MITPIHFMWAAIAVSIVIGGLIVAAFIADWRRDARAGRHASIPEAAPAAPGAPAVHHVEAGPPAEFLAAPVTAPPEIAHEGDREPWYDAAAPIAGQPVPAPRAHQHDCAPGCRLPPLSPALAAVVMLTWRLEATVPRALAEMQRLRDEAKFPWLRSGQYEARTGDFTRRDAELVRAAMEQAGEPT